MDDQFVNRIRTLVQKAGGQQALARASGLSLGGIQRYLRGGEPTRTVLIRLSEAMSVPLLWLVTGEEPRLTEGGRDTEDLPLYGFGESAQQGWYESVEFGLKTTLECADPDSFALAVRDNSLMPMNIKKGQVCIVSPNTHPRTDDIVYVELESGMAALRQYLGQDGEWVNLRGWLDSGEEGEAPVPVDDRIRVSKITKLAPVIYVKRRSV